MFPHQRGQRLGRVWGAADLARCGQACVVCLRGACEERLKVRKARSPHIREWSGEHIDYNGTGPWSVEAIRKRYQWYARSLGATAAELVPHQSAEGGRTWVYPIIEVIDRRIEEGDPAAVEIGIEFLEEEEFFTFGKVLKSNNARALRRASLTERQQQRVRERIVSMMLAGNVPYEFHEYKRLLRKVGIGSLWTALDQGVDRENPYVMRHYEWLNRNARPEAILEQP
jgi:hypothetical protein